MAGVMGIQIQTRESIKSIRAASNFTKRPWLEKTTEDIVPIKKMNIIQHIAWTFGWKYSDVTSFEIINIFLSNCNSITDSFSVTNKLQLRLFCN